MIEIKILSERSWGVLEWVLSYSGLTYWIKIRVEYYVQKQLNIISTIDRFDTIDINSCVGILLSLLFYWRWKWAFRFWVFTLISKLNPSSISGIKGLVIYEILCIIFYFQEHCGQLWALAQFSLREEVIVAVFKLV